MRLLSQWLRRTTRNVMLAPSHGLGLRSLASIATGREPVHREQTIRLRQYQEECIQSVLSYLEDGHKRLGISLATGSGKTVIFTQLIDRVPSPNNDAKQTLILAHRRELVQQAASQCERAYPDKTIEIEMGTTHASGAADITVASVQSIVSADRVSKFNPRNFKLVLVDEAHHIVAPAYMRTLEHFGLETLRENSPALVGVSATFSRFDGLRLGAAIDQIVYHKDYVDMIGEKWLSDVKFTTIKSKANLSKVSLNRDGDFRTRLLSSAVNTDETNEITVMAWMSEAEGCRSTLVFCVDLAHVASLTSMFRKHGVDAQHVTGSTPKRIRSDRLEAFRNRQFPVLLNCGVFTEGTDIPNIDCVLLARPTKSRNLLVQMIGRGMRLFPGKKDCHVIDMVASLETGIVTVPTLFGLDPSEIVKEATSADLQELKARKEEEASTLLNVGETIQGTGSSALASATLDITHYDTVRDLIEDTTGERHIRAVSQNAWVQVGLDKYILAAVGGILTLSRGTETPSESDVSSEENFIVVWKHSLPPTQKAKSPWSKPRVVATTSAFAHAINAADTFAASKFERIFINKSAPWRKSPATSGQLAFLNTKRDPVVDEPLTELSGITKGQAADMITKLKFGAKGRFAKLQVDRRKAGREAEKVQELRRRETVAIGPLDVDM